MSSYCYSCYSYYLYLSFFLAFYLFIYFFGKLLGIHSIKSIVYTSIQIYNDEICIICLFAISVNVIFDARVV